MTPAFEIQRCPKAAWGLPLLFGRGRLPQEGNFYRIPKRQDLRQKNQGVEQDSAQKTKTIQSAAAQQPHVLRICSDLDKLAIVPQFHIDPAKTCCSLQRGGSMND